MSRSPAFWDSSVLVPLCLAAQASAEHHRLARTLPFVVWWATVVEVHGAICRYARTVPDPDSERRRGVARLQALRQRWREILPADSMRQLAQRVLDSTDLRAADALQLAAALVWCREKPRERLFLTSDQRLGTAARGAGFEVVLL